MRKDTFCPIQHLIRNILSTTMFNVEHKTTLARVMVGKATCLFCYSVFHWKYSRQNIGRFVLLFHYLKNSIFRIADISTPDSITV